MKHKPSAPSLCAMLAVLCAFGFANLAEAKETPKKHDSAHRFSTLKTRSKAGTVRKQVVNSPVGQQPRRVERSGRYATQQPVYYIDPRTPNAVYYSNTYGYPIGYPASPNAYGYPQPRTGISNGANPNAGNSQQELPTVLYKYGQYVQQYPQSTNMPAPYGFAPNAYPNNRYDAKISEAERRTRDRRYTAQVAIHALLLRYGTREGGERFPDREKLTQEAIRYADLLEYGMSHTYTNPETNIAP